MAPAGTEAWALLLTVLIGLLRVVQASSDKPRIQPLAFPEIVNLGEEVTVTCAAAFGRKPFQFVWTKDGRPMVSSKTKYSRVIVDNVAVMTIERVGAEDVGNYTCTVSNDFGSDSATAPLLVDGPPEVHPFFFSKNVALGAEAVVNCAVIGGDGPFEFRWSLNGEHLRTSASKYVEAVSDKIVALTIQKVAPDDVGNYTCTVSNGAGSDSFTATLVVKVSGR
ncbi:SPEG neighbor protein-like [Dermacentor variabilis]|uniref:SPEG neighbor protein-like n=1 Tax=Dermacentor variabilis TaxID=34621 RepID=UPI003F5AF8E4